MSIYVTQTTNIETLIDDEVTIRIYSIILNVLVIYIPNRFNETSSNITSVSNLLIDIHLSLFWKNGLNNRKNYFANI